MEINTNIALKYLNNRLPYYSVLVICSRRTIFRNKSKGLGPRCYSLIMYDPDRQIRAKDML